MQHKLIFDISYSLLTARLKQTIVAAVGVTFSITMFITLLSFMGGLNKLLDDLVLNRTPHIRLFNEIKINENQPIVKTEKYKDKYNFIKSIKPKNEKIEIFNSNAIIKYLKSDPKILGVAPKTTVPIFYNLGDIGINGIINGIDVEAELKLLSFDDYVVEGNSIDLKNVPNSIILGAGIAKKMLAKLGDNIQVSTNNGSRFQLKVVGFFQSGLDEFDKVNSFCNITTSQKLLGKPNSYITDIQIKLKDINKAPEFTKLYQNIFNVQAIDIQTANAQFETGTSIRTLISYAVGITLLIVAGFGIYNILNMMIYEKMDSIAILKATGFSGKDVNLVFLEIALSIGLVGGLIGLIIGFLFSLIIDQIPFKIDALPTVSTYPVDYNPLFYVIGGIFSILTTYFSGYFPARKASKIDPVDIIRGK